MCKQRRGAQFQLRRSIRYVLYMSTTQPVDQVTSLGNDQSGRLGSLSAIHSANQSVSLV